MSANWQQASIEWKILTKKLDALQAEVKELRQQRDLLGQALLDCKAIAEQANRPPSARLELIRDRATPILMVWRADVAGQGPTASTYQGWPGKAGAL